MKKQPVIVGLDVSTRTGCVVFEGGRLRVATELTLPPLAKGSYPFQRVSRNHAIVKMMEPHIHDANLIVLEGYGYANNFTFGTLVEIGTFIREWCLAARVRFIEVSPKTLKKFVSGKHNATKPQMIKAVSERWGVTTKNDNIADAYGLAMIGRAVGGERNIAYPEHGEIILDMKTQLSSFHYGKVKT